MPAIEGLTPSVLWTTAYGLVALCALFMVFYKVYETIRKEIERRKQKKEAQNPDFAEKVSQKVIEKLEPRFSEIERNLSKDKTRLESHERAIESMNRGQDEIHDGLTAICKFMLVISTYGNIGNNEKVKEANAELQKYLAEKL